MARQSDWRWELEDGTVVVRDLETRTLLLLAQPGSVTASLSVNALDSGSRGDDESNDGGAVAQDLDPYVDELQPLVEDLIAQDLAIGAPASVKLLPSVNALLVTARPSTSQRVAEIVDLYNDRVSKSVRVSLTVYEVTNTDKHSIGSRLTAMANGADAGLLGSWNVRPLEPDGQFRVTADDPSTDYFGSEFLLEWLDSEGDATINFNDSIEVRNNQIAASSSTRTYQYISSITREQDALGRERTEVQRDSLRTGWSISVQPTIGLDLVTVRLSLARRSLVDERPFQFGESQGTNFVTDDAIRAMTVSLGDGETRIVTALTSSDERRNRNKLVGIPLRRGGSHMKTESVLLLRVDLI